MRRSFNTRYRMNISINSSRIDGYNCAAIVALRRFTTSTSENPYRLKNSSFTQVNHTYVIPAFIRPIYFYTQRVYNERVRHVYAVFV